MKGLFHINVTVTFVGKKLRRSFWKDTLGFLVVQSLFRSCTLFVSTVFGDVCFGLFLHFSLNWPI